MYEDLSVFLVGPLALVQTCYMNNMDIKLITYQYIPTEDWSSHHELDRNFKQACCGLRWCRYTVPG